MSIPAIVGNKYIRTNIVIRYKKPDNKITKKIFVGRNTERTNTENDFTKNPNGINSSKTMNWWLQSKYESMYLEV